MRKDLQVEQVIRCLRISPDGSQMVCGDWYGNIRMHDLKSDQLAESRVIEAHEEEVLSIDMVPHKEGYLLVSGAKDNLIQIYDSKNDFQEI